MAKTIGTFQGAGKDFANKGNPKIDYTGHDQARCASCGGQTGRLVMIGKGSKFYHPRCAAEIRKEEK
jgi:hypothetical protein